MKTRFSNVNESFGKWRAVFSLLGVLALILCASLTARAQKTTADVRGSVADEQGAAIAGAEVTITNVETSFSRTTVSGSDGEYNFSDLPLGHYNIHVTHAGFKSSEQTGITLHANDSLVVNIGLKVGAISESVYELARFELGRALLQQGDAAGAVENFEAAKKLFPGREATYFQLSQAYRRAGRLPEAEQALATYQKMIEASRQKKRQELEVDQP